MTTYGRFVSKGGFRWEQVSADACFHIITGGSGTFITNGVAHHAEEGMLYVFHPGDHVIYYDHPDRPWRYRWCTLAGPATALLGQANIGNEAYLHTLSNLNGIIQHLDAIEKACKNGVPAAHLGSATLFKIIHDVTQQADAPLTHAQQAKSIIDTWSFGSPTVEEVAIMVGVERSTLFRCFKAEFGLPVKSYVDGVRLEKAARLLRMSDESVKSIARTCGYWNQLYFSRAFSKRFGVSPSMWRRSSG